MDNKKSYVYKIMCKITGEYYFGSSFYIMRNSYWGGGTKIRELVAQYGKENFVKEILDQFDDRVEAHKKENQYIEQFINDDKCLNRKCEHHYKSFSSDTIKKMADGHLGSKNLNFGKKLSDETKAKISNSHKGKLVSKSTREKLSIANTGKHHTDETKSKISAAKLGNTNLRGKHLSDETRSKMSASHRGKTFSEEHRERIGAAKLGKHWRKNPVTGKREWYD